MMAAFFNMVIELAKIFQNKPGVFLSALTLIGIFIIALAAIAAFLR